MGLKRASATSFNPQTQGTLVAWYDASTLGLSNGTQVTSWTDSKTGSPYTVTKTADSGVVYATSQQNGLSTIYWAVSSYPAFTPGPDSSTYPYTIAAIISIGSSGYGSILGSDYQGIQFHVDSSNNYLTVNSAGTTAIGTGTTAVSTSGYHLVVATITSSSYAFYIDGAAAGSGSHSVSLLSGKTFRVGDSQGPGEAFFGYMGEIQIYSSALSSGDLSALHSYAVSKWATP